MIAFWILILAELSFTPVCEIGAAYSFEVPARATPFVTLEVP